MQKWGIAAIGLAVSAGIFAQTAPPPWSAPQPAVDLWNANALKTPYRDNLSAEEKVAGLSKLWSEAKFNFVNFALVPTLDWDALYLSYLPKVLASKSTLEYYQLLTAFYAQLHDGHTNVYPPRELRDQVYARPPLRTALVEGRVIVTEVRSPSLQQQGIAAGLELLAVDGVPVRDYAATRVAPYVSSSTPQDHDVRTYTYMLLAGAKAQDVVLTLAGATGQPVQHAVRRGDYADLVKPRPNFEFKLLAGNVGYVALNSFEDEEVPGQFAMAFADISKTDALIFDVRDNGGGNSGNGWKILAYLTDKPFKTLRWTTRQYVPTYRAWDRNETWLQSSAADWAPEPGKLYGKPVLLLTSARTYSAAEDFAVTFDAMKRGRIVGEATGGSSGQPLSFALPGGGGARVCTKHDSYPDGREFIGRGVQPQRVVHPTISDLRAGRDAVLAAALDEVQQALGTKARH